MTTDTVLKSLEEIGLRVVLDGERRPRLVGNQKLVTPRLLKVLRWHKAEIVRRLLPKPMRQWLWRTGHTYTADEQTPVDYRPAGAWWWRLEGETTWKPIPGTPGETMEAPAA